MATSHRRAFVISVSALTVLVGVALFSASASRIRKPQQNNSGQAKPKKDQVPRGQDIQARIPTAEYDAPEPTNQEEKIKRRNRNKHYDGKHLVMSNPTNSGGGVARRSAVFDSLPALPVTQSDVILTGDVLNSEAHLSNDKTGVYSEFTIQVDTVLKGSIPSLSQTNLITISRFGGNVRYPSGPTMTYQTVDQNMPGTGKKYLFFLRAVDDSFEIVTGYDVGSARVQPLDEGQFNAFRGKDTAVLVATVRNVIAKN